MPIMIYKKDGKFKIDDFFHDIYNYYASADYTITFDDANIVVNGNKIKKLVASYDYDDDAVSLVVTFSNGSTVTYSTPTTILAFIPEGLEGIARIKFRGEAGDEANTYDLIFMENVVTMFLYRLNSEKNVVDKSLIFVDAIEGSIRSAINVKTPIINYENFSIENTFNYVYIPKLKRYYYVQNVELSTKNMTALALSEDVLMSFKDLILSQYAYVTRNEDIYDPYLPDSRRAYYDKPNIAYLEYDTGEYFNNNDVAGASNDPVCYVLEVVRGD